ncbi:MAG: hypothetical protein COU47_01105 [Candidatus Niyogibacteria bacterium CG10_big_fil_rev_8_21_14_0_10_46_36]|uniref:Uncharacterized protein n=1 Tax=Candidatus Niyogibacteria bacterium CG10_big_fil_rev_8_21_14_0_10_46_36 TaxID=1974726 RepID=A0A2H0TFF5_9BACT|nr:MAG: hypothetical protein COU47_01105 [Candidatus Niyogibacteria bacterium CG10_big_fil_rev_8_21_14_0_10_46_36]
MNTNTGRTVEFPQFSGIRCLMMPYIQGDSASIPDIYASYREIVDSVFLKKGDIGFLTIDESLATGGKPHRGQRAKFERALHTEAGRDPAKIYCWGGGGWGKPPHRVTLDRDVRILLANNLDDSCAVWDAEHEDTSLDGDIGHAAGDYPYDCAVFLKAGEVHEIGILTPHESLPVPQDFNRQFLRIVSSGVHGREEYFTRNPLVSFN